MNAPLSLAARPSSLEPEGDEELSLMALLDLCSLDDADAPAIARRSLRPVGDRLRAWTGTWSLRATGWGTGPQGSWRAW